MPCLWVCGNSRIELFDADATFDVSKPLWSWDSQTGPGLPDDRREWFIDLDEVKPAEWDGIACLLVTASWRGGGAVVRRSDGGYLFSLRAPNAHSIELLPGGWVAIAASQSEGGDRLFIQHLSAGVNATAARAEFPLLHGHGAVFEPGRSRLWVSGASAVQLYHWESDRETFKCQLAHEIKLPDVGAHDMQPAPRGSAMIVTTAHGVWSIDPQTLSVSPFPQLEKLNDVKGVSVDSSSGTIAYVKGEGEVWWSEHIEFMDAGGSRRRWTLPGRHLYKVRWDQPRWLE